jgi:hypothetical protein
VRSRGPGWKHLAGIGLLAGLLILGLFALASWVRATRDWPTERSDNLLLIGILIIGLIPLALVLIDALIQRGGSLSFQGITIDLAATTSPAVDFRIDTNIGVEGETVSDSSSRQILDALRKSATSDIAVLDLEDGKAWWETRLFILAAGAVRLGKPRAIVFGASTDRQAKTFLGWASPRSLLDALLDGRNPRHVTYLEIYGLALDAAEKWQREVDKLGPNPPAGTAVAVPSDLPPVPQDWSWQSWVLVDDRGRPNPFIAEQFIALALGKEIEDKWRAVPPPTDPNASSAEKFPKAVTITEQALNTMFADKLHRSAIEETATSDAQVDAFLRDTGEFAAITRHGTYVRMASRTALMEGLVQQLLVSARRGSG